MIDLDNSDDMNLQECHTHFPIVNNQKSMFLTPTYCEEVFQVINYSLNSNKSPGIAGISAALLKNTSFYISPILVHIINLNFKTGVFPGSLKKAVVIPLHKKVDVTNMNDYKPISLASNFSKIIEKILKKGY